MSCGRNYDLFVSYKEEDSSSDSLENAGGEEKGGDQNKNSERGARSSEFDFRPVWAAGLGTNLCETLVVFYNKLQ